MIEDERLRSTVYDNVDSGIYERIREIGNDLTPTEFHEQLLTPGSMSERIKETTKNRIKHGNVRCIKPAVLDELLELEEVHMPDTITETTSRIRDAKEDELIIIPSKQLWSDEIFKFPNKTQSVIPLTNPNVLLEENLKTALANKHPYCNVEPEKLWAGYSFTTNPQGVWQVIQLESVVRGFLYKEGLGMMPKVELYPMDWVMTGGQARIQGIKSFSDDEKTHAINFKGLPLFRRPKEKPYENGLGIMASNQTSERAQYNGMKVKRINPITNKTENRMEEAWDAYTICAYLCLEDRLKKYKNGEFSILRPFTKPSPKTVRYLLKLVNNAVRLVEVHDQKTDLLKGYALRPLKWDQTEPLLWSYVGLNNVSKNF